MDLKITKKYNPLTGIDQYYITDTGELVQDYTTLKSLGISNYIINFYFYHKVNSISMLNCYKLLYFKILSRGIPVSIWRML